MSYSDLDGFSDFDRHMMAVALTMARRGLGVTAPNPSVGAVVADEATGETIARGVTQPGGRPHAEPEALRRAGARARGATLYVTLEPCAHHGKTPPCADAIVAAGVARVVIGVEDPDPRTRGGGIARLREAGIRVDVGLLADEARWVTLGHILRVTRQRPFVQLKMALDAAGEVPLGKDGRARMVTGPEARAQGHRLRAESDAILIGGGTARDDNPDLTCRLPGLAARSPIRVVLSRGLDLSPDLKLVRTAREVPVWVVTGLDADEGRRQALEAAGVRIFLVGSPPPGGEGGDLTAKGLGSPPPSLPHKGGEMDARDCVAGGLPISDLLAQLCEAGVTRLLVEGGAAVWQAFAAAGCVDELVLFQAGAARSEAGKASFSDATALAARYAPGVDLAPASQRAVGHDLMTVFRSRMASQTI